MCRSKFLILWVCATPKSAGEGLHTESAGRPHHLCLLLVCVALDLFRVVDVLNLVRE